MGDVSLEPKHDADDDAAAAQPALSAPVRSRAARIGFALALGVAFATFLALGSWQLQRRAWKVDLIARVEARIHAEPVAPPAVPIRAARDEYLRVRIEGTYLPDRDTRVRALTELGAGFWVLTPLRRNDGSLVLVNRGFIAADPPPPPRQNPPPGAVTVTGLLRLSEPGGAFLLRNDPASDRWTSRDVAAIAAARGLQDVAPYFIDAEADSRAGPGPIGGLTVVRFPNNHLQYALTWYGMALLTAFAAARLFAISSTSPSAPYIRRGAPRG